MPTEGNATDNHKLLDHRLVTQGLSSSIPSKDLSKGYIPEMPFTTKKILTAGMAIEVLIRI